MDTDLASETSSDYHTMGEVQKSSNCACNMPGTTFYNWRACQLTRTSAIAAGNVEALFTVMECKLVIVKVTYLKENKRKSE
jgi:hypothetical protein